MNEFIVSDMHESWWERWRKRRYKRKHCFHHDIGGNPANTRPAVSWIKQELINTGMQKMFWCDEGVGGCGKAWIV